MATLPLYLDVDSSRAEPLQTQVYRGIRRAIVEGRVTPGAYLPSTRLLASDLKVGRNTVMRAIQRLRVEGFVESLVGAGIRVRDAADTLLAAPAANPGKASETRSPRVGARSDASLDLPNTSAVGSTPMRPFRMGLPPIDVFPSGVWARLVSRRWRSSPKAMIESGDPLGYPPLRALISDYLRTTRGLECSADHVVITSGAQHSLEISVRALLKSGDHAWVEDPARPETCRVLAGAGVYPVPVAVDREGFNASLARRLANARVAVVTPSCHFPTGVTLTLRRRLDLISWAHEADAWIIEDDYCAETRLVGRPLPAIHRLDRGRRTIYVGSFAATVFPGLCVGYVVVPDEIREAIQSARAVGDQHAPTPQQVVLCDFIDHGHFAAYLNRLRGALTERYEALMYSLAANCGSVVAPWPANAGMHVVAWLPAGASEREIVRDAARVGVEVRGLGRLRQVPGPPGLLLCFGGWSVPAITDAATRLAQAFDSTRNGSPASRPSSVRTA